MCEAAELDAERWGENPTGRKLWALCSSRAAKRSACSRGGKVVDEEGKVVSREINPKFLEFQDKFNELLIETKDVAHGKFLLEDFELVESAEVYPVFFKLISAE